LGEQVNGVEGEMSVGNINGAERGGSENDCCLMNLGEKFALGEDSSS
jgi:hypothetical protein